MKLLLIAVLLVAPAAGFSDWKEGKVPEEVVKAREEGKAEKAALADELLEKAQPHVWGPQEHGTTTNPAGDITAHEFDLTNNQGDGSDDNLWINANLSTTPPNVTYEEYGLNSTNITRETCGASPDMHGLVCKLVFSDWIGVEVVCVCKDACTDVGGVATQCTQKWAHILMQLVEEDTGCTEYTGQLTVPGFWGKCRPASIVENPIVPIKDSAPADNVVGGTNYNPGGGWSGKEQVQVELMQAQVQKLQAEKQQLVQEQAAWAAEKESLLAQRESLSQEHTRLAASL